MTLKVPNRVPIFAREASTPIMEAKEIMMRCSICGKHAFGPRHLMKAAIDEHRRLHHAEAGSHMTLWYPRA